MSSSASARVLGYRADIDGLRAVAICLVALFHAGIPGFAGGFTGVDVFYVLSGFLISGLLLDELRVSGQIRLGHFYARRARRLLPLSALVLLSTFVASCLLLPPLDRVGLAGDAKAAAIWIANWHFAAGSTDYMNAAERSPLLHYWSLSVEEQFYLAWPLILMLVAGNFSRRRRASGRPLGWPYIFRRATLALFLLATASFTVSLLTSKPGDPWSYFGLHTRAWELAVGAGLALARPALARLPALASLGCGVVGLLLVSAGAVVIDATTPFPGIAALLPVMGTALLVAAGSGPTAPVGVSALLASRGPAFVGRVSYGWYLWHWPVLVIAGAAGGGAEPATGLDLRRMALAVGCLAAAFGLAVGSHRLVEQPVRRARWLAAVPARSLALGTALTLLPVLSGDVIRSGAARLGSTEAARAVVLDVDALEAAGGPGGGDGLRLEAVGRRSPASVENVRLTTSPAQARADQPQAGNCLLPQRSTSMAGPCQFGKTDGHRTVVLLGDSHAAHLFPALDRAAQQRGWRLFVWTRSACPPVDVRSLSPTAQPTENALCAQWRSSVLDRLRSLGKVDAVVLARYRFYRMGVLNANGSAVSSDAQFLQVWSEGARRTFQTLRPLARAVVVARDTPEPGTDVPACLSEHPNDLSKCAFERQGHVSTDRLLTEAERSGARGVLRLRGVDLTPVLCPGKVCPVVTSRGEIVYRDQHHLTATASRRLANPLGALLAPLVDRRD